MWFVSCFSSSVNCWSLPKFEETANHTVFKILHINNMNLKALSCLSWQLQTADSHTFPCRVCLTSYCSSIVSFQNKDWSWKAQGESAVGEMKVSVYVTMYRNLKLSLNNIQATTWGWNESVTECFNHTQLPIFSLRKDRKTLWNVFQWRHFYLKFKFITQVSGWSSEESWFTHHFSQNLGYLLVKCDVIKSIDFPRMKFNML